MRAAVAHQKQGVLPLQSAWTNAMDPIGMRNNVAGLLRPRGHPLCTSSTLCARTASRMAQFESIRTAIQSDRANAGSKTFILRTFRVRQKGAGAPRMSVRNGSLSLGHES